MRVSTFASWASITILALSSSFVSAQSDPCHACILKAIPSVGNCTSLTSTQLSTLDTVILGQAPPGGSVDSFKTANPQGFACLNSLMWDIVEYKGQLWGQCLDPTSSCPWAEMMQWLEMIPKIAAIYGAPNPPAQVLKGGPA
ncbi:hypothetical protein EMPS_00720 [Entomortierella parvispora]|uniref:Uncharacterized protein n=1 Tax=Entomortierella parvispora TaxID=205924 RepID=A0A9P3H1M3_9FUNG|nr:hypothetical protein EMPS_00720 [Entomortierella parvispora]